MNTTRFLSVLALCLLTATTLCAQRGGGGDGDRGGGFGGRGGGPPGGGFGGRGGGTPGGGGPPGGGFSGRGGGTPGGGFGGRGGGGDPSSFLSRLDANGNGIIDPEEQQGPAQFIISRMQQSDPSIKPGQPIPLSKITEGFERMRSGGDRDRGSDRGDDTRQAADDALMPELLVPGFGLGEEDAEPNLLMGFGAAAEMLSVPVTADDERQAGETLRRYDRNRDGFITKDELSSRFSGNPMDFDRNRDGKLSQSELSVRYARRREGEEQARESRDRERDRGRERTREQSVEIPDVFNGRRSYRPTTVRKLPEGLPGFFTDKDANNDGQVTMAEFASDWNEDVLHEFFDSDFNRDGVITAVEALRSVEEGGASQMASTSSPSSAPSAASGSSTPAASSTASAGGAPDDKYVKVAQRIVDRYDENKDKMLTASEWGKMLMSPADADGDRDGKISVNEYAMWMQSRQKN